MKILKHTLKFTSNIDNRNIHLCHISLHLHFSEKLRKRIISEQNETYESLGILLTPTIKINLKNQIGNFEKELQISILFSVEIFLPHDQRRKWKQM